jgi:MtN3 and saliva related transmembrane protein
LSIEIVGWAAVGLTQVFWIPNIIRIFRTRDVEGYSLLAWLILLAGASCWFVYFAAQGDLVGIVANISGIAGSSITLGCILRWGRGWPRGRTARSGSRSEMVLGPEPLTTDQG